jgi:hypothetical protein
MFTRNQVRFCAEDVGERQLWIRPAVVSVLGVTDVRKAWGG